LSLRDFEFIPFVFVQSASMMTGLQIIHIRPKRFGLIR